MERNKIIYNGLCCCVNVKAAFVDMCLQTPELSSKMLLRAVVEARCGDRLFPVGEESNGVMTVRLELDEEKRERIYEAVFERRLREGAVKKLLEPIEMMHQKEMRVDVIPFLVCAVVRNERSRGMLEKLTAGRAEDCINAFRKSEYNTARFLHRYLLTERKAAKLAAGLLLLLKTEEGGETYRQVMDMIYAGYRPVKNVIKKLDCLKGERYRDSMARDQTRELDLSRMVVQMVVAEDLCVPIVQDYDFCQAVCMLKSFEDDCRRSSDEERDLSEGKRIYRRFLREHWNPGTYYVSAFLEDESEDSVENKELWKRMESLFCQFGIKTAALAGLCLEKWEAEMLCAIFGEKDWERYKELLLVTTLCKYIQQIEAMYENDIPEEIQYRRACEENTVKRLEGEKKRLEQRICELERQRLDRECELSEAMRRMERLEREASKKEEAYEREREKLQKLRSLPDGGLSAPAGICVTGYPSGNMGEKADGNCSGQGKETEEKAFQMEGLDRSIVIGGHRNWQKKMRQCLPDSQFLESDHMHFDPAMLRNKKYIIVNTDILKHGLYYKIMSERKKGQKILYVHGNNVNRTLREIADQL